MAKILNIDSFAKDERSLKLNGVDYPIQEMTVENFIETTKQALSLEEATLVDQVQGTIKMIMRSIPTIPEEQLRKIKLEHLQTIVAFIRGDHLVDGVEDTDAPEKKEPVKTTKRTTKK